MLCSLVDFGCDKLISTNVDRHFEFFVLTSRKNSRLLQD